MPDTTDTAAKLKVGNEPCFLASDQLQTVCRDLDVVSPPLSQEGSLLLSAETIYLPLLPPVIHLSF